MRKAPRSSRAGYGVSLFKRIDKPYISLVNKVEAQFLLISWQRESKYWIKKLFDKTIAAQVHGSNFVIFNFLENGDFFCNSVESSEFLNSLT